MVDLELGQVRIEGQGRKSRSNPKNHVFILPLHLLLGQGQRSWSRSKVMFTVTGQVNGQGTPRKLMITTKVKLATILRLTT